MSRVSADGCSVLLLYAPRRGPITRAFVIRGVNYDQAVVLADRSRSGPVLKRFAEDE